MYFLCVIFLLISTASALFSNFNHRRRNVDNSHLLLSKIKTKWIEQPFDHFDSNEKRTFKSRYYENLQLWKTGGPVYLYIGGESDISEVEVELYSAAFLTQIAEETNGAILALEHRYYGLSVPDIPKDNPIEYYKFLSSHQALEDLANFIKQLKKDPNYKSSKVVVIGGSYAGNLAAWSRELYPDLVDAALASSAPVLAKKDFYEYLDAVRYTFGKYGTENCLKNIENKFKKVEELLKTANGIEKLKKDFNICPETNMSVLENQQLFFYAAMYSDLEDTAQGGTPQEVVELCRKYENESFSELMSDHYKMLPIFSGDCADLNYSSIDWTKQEDAAWTHQFCTEFGYLQTTSLEKQPFVHWGPLGSLLNMCKGFVKGDPEKVMDEGIAKTNQLYGGLTPNVTKVLFTHGDMDPWHRLGVLKDLGPDAPVIMVNGTSHCRFMYEELVEPQEMKEKRKYGKDLIKKWIS